MKDRIDLTAAAATLLGIFVGWITLIRPRWRKFVSRIVAALDTIAGREAVVDSITGRELAPALPSVGQRMDTLEQTVSKLVEAEIQRQQIDQRVTEAHQRIDLLERRVHGLEDGAIERVANKAESVAAWRAVEAVAKQGDPGAPEIEEHRP